MSPQTVQDRDWQANFLTNWKCWRPGPLDDLGPRPWAGRSEFWNADVSAALIDRERTAALTSIDAVVGARCGGLSGAWTSGTPWHTVPADMPLTRVDPMNEPWWPFWTLQARLDAKAKRLPMPSTVRRENDPVGGGDSHGVFWQPGADRLHETISLIRQFNGTWQASSIQQWDTTRSWTEQKGGVIAIDTPMLPMIPSYEEFVAGRIDHCLAYISNGTYSRAIVGPARASDGTSTTHPLRGGERLRLPAGTHRRYAEGSHERTLCVALETHGMVVSDKGQFAGLRMPQDERLSSLNFLVRLSEFVVVAQ